MFTIDYPKHDFRLQHDDGRKMIFDEWRKIWVTFTPEEWVRQNFLQYLVQVKAYPSSLIAIEKEIQLGELRKRFDVLVYDRAHHPWMLIECKEMEVSLEQSVLDQLLRYHIAVPVPYLVVTNGRYCAGFEKKEKQLHALAMLPEYGY